jgi:hypothetical protein
LSIARSATFESMIDDVLLIPASLLTRERQ